MFCAMARIKNTVICLKNDKYMIKKLLFILFCYYSFMPTTTAQVVNYSFIKAIDINHKLNNSSLIILGSWDNKFTLSRFPVSLSFKCTSVSCNGRGISSASIVEIT